MPLRRSRNSQFCIGNHASLAPSAACERAEIVEHKQIHAVEIFFKGSLAFAAREIDSRFHVVGGKHLKSVLGRIPTQACCD